MPADFIRGARYTANDVKSAIEQSGEVRSNSKANAGHFEQTHVTDTGLGYSESVSVQADAARSNKRE
ncbi:MAG: hypothetical protein WCI88_08920 [Chloroflexota bacterium]